MDGSVSVKLQKNFQQQVREVFWSWLSSLEPRPAVLGPPETHWKPKQSALTKNTKEPSRPNIWDRDKEQCHIHSERLQRHENDHHFTHVSVLDVHTEKTMETGE